MSERIAASPRGRRDLLERAAVTAALVLLAQALAWIPVPFTSQVDAVDLLGRALSIREVGLSPVLSAFVLVELVALAVPRLRRRRNGSEAERAGLTRAAWVLATFFAAVQAYTTVSYLAAARGSLGLAGSPDDRLALAVGTLTLVAGTALLSAIALVLSRRGLGSGLAVLFASDAAVELLRSARKLASGEASSGSPVRLVVLAVVVAAPLALLVLALRRSPGHAAPVPAPASGLVPLTWAENLWMSPVTFAPLLGLGHAERFLDAWSRYLPQGRLALALLLTLPLAWLFTRRRRVEASWRAATPAAPPGPGAVRTSVRRAYRWSLVVVGAVAAVPIVVALPLAVSTISALALIVAIAIDVVAEARARARLGPLVPAYPLQRVYAAPPALAALAAAGIPAAPRALRYRVLEQFFAPFAPVEILVPPERVADAAAICARVARAPDAAPPSEPSST